VHDLTNAQFAKEASPISVTSPTTKEGISTLSKYKDMFKWLAYLKDVTDHQPNLVTTKL
jgi:hypothetical protein